jgi:pimeloyl-ACP methyl ester carboxylesterase
MVWTALGPVEVTTTGEGPALLAIHGQPGGHDQALALARIAGDGMRVVAPSRPGYLNTPDAHADLDAQADLMAALLDALGIPHAAVLALSAGAPVALRLAERHPDRVRAVALIAPVTGPDTRPITAVDRLLMSRAALGAVTVVLRVAPSLAIGGAFVESGFPSARALVREARRIAREPHLVDRLRTTIHTALPYGPRRRGAEADDQMIAALHSTLGCQVTAPVLAVHGDCDIEVPAAHSRVLPARIAGCRVIILGGAGHVVDLHPLWHQAEAAIRAFVTNPPPPRSPDPPAHGAPSAT